MSDAETVCTSIYNETAAFYAAHRPQISPKDLGFRVLYGPPRIQAPILFVGYQPGGRTIESESHHHGWPAECDYAHAPWPLAKRIRDIWGADLVSNCTGLNAIFFRAPTVRDWRRLDRQAIRQAENFSMKRAERIARVLLPRRIVIIGIGTFNMLIPNGSVAIQSGPRVLAKSGELWGAQAIGVIHLSGARVSRSDLAQLQAFSN